MFCIPKGGRPTRRSRANGHTHPLMRRPPGFLSSPGPVFDALWARRVSIPMAGQHIDIPDFSSSVLIMALHSARSSTDNPRHARELAHLIDLSKDWGEAQRRDIAALAAETGCAGALATVLPLLGVEIHVDVPPIDAEARHEWRLRLEGRTSPRATWMRYLREGGLLQAPRRLLEALWPEEDFLRATRQIDEGPVALRQERLARLLRGIPKVPLAVLELLGVRGENTVDAVTHTDNHG